MYLRFTRKQRQLPRKQLPSLRNIGFFSFPNYGNFCGFCDYRKRLMWIILNISNFNYPIFMSCWILFVLISFSWPHWRHINDLWTFNLSLAFTAITPLQTSLQKILNPSVQKLNQTSWYLIRKIIELTLSWRRSLSYRNQSIDLQSKSVDWFLHERGLRYERVKNLAGMTTTKIPLINLMTHFTNHQKQQLVYFLKKYACIFYVKNCLEYEFHKFALE